MRKRKHKRKHKKERYYLSDRRAFNYFARHNRKIYEMIKAFREQVITLGVANPF